MTLPWLSGSKLSKKFKDSENQEQNCLSCVLDEYEINRKNYYQRSFLVQKKSVTDNFCRHSSLDDKSPDFGISVNVTQKKLKHICFHTFHSI